MGPLLGRAMTRTASVQCPPCPLWELAAQLPRSGWVQPTLAHRRWELAKGGGRLRLTQKEWSLLPAHSLLLLAAGGRARTGKRVSFQ